jgi:hypothetical protein
MEKQRMRRVAAHEVKAAGEVIQQAVVELKGGKVERYYPFTDELPQTEWLGGTILIDDDCAYWNGIKLK